MSYFILKSGEDGTSIDGPFTEAEVLQRITPDKHGDTYYGHTGFHSAIPDSDKGYWCDDGCKLLVIRGEIVVPTPKSKVVEWSLETGGTASKEGT